MPTGRRRGRGLRKANVRRVTRANRGKQEDPPPPPPPPPPPSPPPPPPPSPPPPPGDSFAQLPASSIRAMAQSKDLSDAAVAALAESSSYIVREVIKKAMLFMRHSGRAKLKPDDLNKALKWSNVPPAHGHVVPEPVRKKGGKKVDPCIHIMDHIEKGEHFETMPPSALNVQWVGVEGVPVYSSKKKPEQRPNQRIGIMNQYIPEKKWCDINRVSPEHMVYYRQITRAVMSVHQQLVKTALGDVQKNRKIAPLLPHFLNFIDDQVRKQNHELEQMEKLLKFLKAILLNPSMYLGHEVCLTPLFRSVLYCIIEPQDISSQVSPSHWAVRDLASNLLKVIMKLWANPVNNQYAHTLPKLEKVFESMNKPIGSLYGAIVAITALGAEAVEESLYPHMPKLLEYVDRIRKSRYEAVNTPRLYPKYYERRIDDMHTVVEKVVKPKGDPFTSGLLTEIEASEKVHIALLNAAEVFLKGKIKKELYENAVPSGEGQDSCSLNVLTPDISTQPSCSHTHEAEDLTYKKKSLRNVYKDLYQYFGEPLATRLPFITRSTMEFPLLPVNLDSVCEKKPEKIQAPKVSNPVKLTVSKKMPQASTSRVPSASSQEACHDSVRCDVERKGAEECSERQEEKSESSDQLDSDCFKSTVQGSKVIIKKVKRNLKTHKK